MSTALQTQDNKAEALERAMLIGDLSKLTPDERLFYYKNVCESVGLNPMTRPFEYMSTDGKLSLYARKEAAAQLAAKHGVSIGKPDLQFAEGLCIVSVTATNAAGRTDSDIGAVALDKLQGTPRANAIMKAITKAKRRVTLSICGLGLLDESEVADIRGAEIVPVEPEALPESQSQVQWSGKEVLREQVQSHPQIVAAAALAAAKYASPPMAEQLEQMAEHLASSVIQQNQLAEQTRQAQDMTPEEFAKTASDIFDAELGELPPEPPGPEQWCDPEWLEYQIKGVDDGKHRRMLAELYADAYEQYECRPMVCWAASKEATNDVEFLDFLRKYKFTKGAFLDVLGNWVHAQNGVAQ